MIKSFPHLVEPLPLLIKSALHLVESAPLLIKRLLFFVESPLLLIESPIHLGFDDHLFLAALFGQCQAGVILLGEDVNPRLG